MNNHGGRNIIGTNSYVFYANQICCKKCGSSAIRTKETKTNTLDVKEWLVVEGSMGFFDYEVDIDETEHEEGEYFWCKDCEHKFPIHDALEHLTLPMNITEEEE